MADAGDTGGRPGGDRDGSHAAMMDRDPRFSAAQRAWALMLAAGLLAGFANLAVLRADDVRGQVVMVVGDHAAGTPATALQTTVMDLPVADPLDLRLVTPAMLAGLRDDGQHDVVTTTDLDDGEVLRLGDLSTGWADDRRAMSLPVPVGRAVNGDLSPGDRIDVIAEVADTDGSGGRVEVVAAGLEVLGLGRPDGALAGTDSLVITVAVEEVDVLPLAAALRTGAVDVIRTGRGGQATAGGSADG